MPFPQNRDKLCRSLAVVFTHVFSDPRIQPGRAMLWSVQRGSIILVLPEIGYSVVKVEGFWILPLTYYVEDGSGFCKVFDTVEKIYDYQIKAYTRISDAACQRKNCFPLYDK